MIIQLFTASPRITGQTTRQVEFSVEWRQASGMGNIPSIPQIACFKLGSTKHSRVWWNIKDNLIALLLKGPLWAPYCKLLTETEDSRENNWTIEVWPKSNPLRLYSGTDRFKMLDLIDRVPEELWTEALNIIQEAVIKTTPRKRNAKIQNGCLRRPYK